MSHSDYVYRCKLYALLQLPPGVSGAVGEIGGRGETILDSLHCWGETGIEAIERWWETSGRVAQDIGSSSDRASSKISYQTKSIC